MGSLLAALRGGRREPRSQPQQAGPSRVTEQDKAVLVRNFQHYHIGSTGHKLIHTLSLLSPNSSRT